VISLDTNVILRFLLYDVPEQTARVTAVIAKEQVYVTDVVVAETAFVLEKTMELPREDVAELLTSFLGFANVVSNPYFLPQAIKLYRKHSELSIVDCYAAAEAQAYSNKLMTFDKKLAQLAH
jgi:predicted nucleic acid-binding protein